MAVRWAMDSKEYDRGSTYKFAPEAIIVNPAENGRYEDPDIEWLVADIRARGQETPVTVRNDGGKPVLVFGYQRVRAIKILNERYPADPRRKVICVFKQLNPEEAFIANISENRMRNEVTPIDDAHNIKRLLNVYGYSDDKVIAAFFPGDLTGKAREDARRWVRERMALIGLSPVAEQAVRDGRVKLHAAIQLNKLPEAEQAALVSGAGPVKIKDVNKAAAKPAPVPRKPKASGSATEFAPQTFGEPAAKRLASTGIDLNWDRPEEDEAEAGFSPSYLGLQMVEAIGGFFHRAHLAGEPIVGLADFCDAVADCIEGAQAVDSLFGGEVLAAVAAYRKARPV